MMDQLTIPNKLYGRDRDMITMIKSFERVSSGHGEILLVPGSSGVGKTALVQELRIPIRDRNGFFITGKFDQYQQNVPYFAFRQALAELCRELQSGNDRQSLRLKADILQAIGDLGQVLIDLVPEFESFFGLQPHLEDISPQEARYRFADVFRNFMKVICRPEHPLTLFIDDWQWADTASFELLKQIQVGVTLHYLLVIVSYRDNEVDFAHPLASTINDLRSHAVPVEVLQVKNITVGDVREMVTDTLRPAAEDVEGLSAIIHSKTLGNPFFVRSFLIFLHEFNLIRLDKTRNCWQWRIEKTEGAGLPGNVLDLFVLKLHRLDSDSRNLLSLAACLGNRFDLETLGIISGRDPEECMALLFSGQAKTLLLPFDGGASNNPAEDIRVPEIYTFLHDRVQQAAYTLIEPAELPDILLKIGRMLLTSLHPEQLDERLFEVVSDLNAGYNLIADYTEQVKVVELNMTAARKAYAAAAYLSALQFYRAANRFFEKPGFAEHMWRDRHELTMRLFMKRAECEFLEGDRNEAEKCIQQSVAHAESALEKADAFNILIVQYTLLARYPEAIAAGRQALEALGIRLPENGYENARNEEIAQVRQELESRLVSSLVELPVMSHPGMLMASKILITMGPPCYRSHQRLWSVIVPKVVNLTLRYGNIPLIGYSHTAFGGLLGWVDNDYATAKEFGELATRLMTGTFRSPSDQSVFYLMIGSSIRHWFKHLRYGTQDYTDAYEIGLRSGNLQYAAYAFGHNMYCRFYQGVPLAGLIQESQRSLEFSRTRLNQWAIDLLEGGLNIFGTLSGEGSPLNGNDAWPEEEYLQRVTDHHNIQITCIYKVLKTFSLLMSGNYDDALVLSDETEPLIYTVGTQGLLPWPEHVFARLLILTALYSKADEERKNKWRPELDRMIGRLRIWADNCPENFEHKYLLAAAELARIDGRPVEAMQLYDKAVEAAQAGDFLQWEGMTNERASSFWLESGNERLAHVYWQHAYVCYDRWGAVAKVRSMETAYRMYLANNLPAGDGSGKPSEEMKLEIKNVLVEKQIMQLRNYVFQMQQNRLRIEAATQAEELARATQRLRVEVVERKKAEEELSIIKTKLELALQSSKMGVWRYNIAENKRSYDNQVCLLLGIDPETFGGTAEDFFVAVHPDDREKINAALKQTIEQSVPYEIEYQAVWSDGSVHYIAARGKLLHDDKGNAQEINGIIWDITERKQAADALLNEKKFSEAIIESIPGMLYVYDDQGNHIRHNKRHEDMTGYSAEELSHLNPLSWYDDKADIIRVEAAISDVFTKGHGEVEAPMRIKNGEKLMMHFTGSRLVMNGNKYFIGVGTDITERKLAEMEKAELEVQNRQLQKAESLGRMAGAIAHHFNNQLYAVMGNLEIAMEDLPRGADISETLAEAQKAAHKAAEVSGLMLTYLGQTPGNQEPVDLSEACRTTLTLLQAAAPKGIILNAELPSSGPVIRADTNQIHQILTNLATNAWEAISDNRGSIVLTTKTVSNADIPVLKRFPIDWQPQSIPYACLEVSDTGCGIADKCIEKIFDPFFTTKFTGRGLGLPVVMGIVKAHGGGVTVESEPGQGSTFRIFLPVSTEEFPIQHDLPVISVALQAGKAENISKIEGGGTMLLIDDDQQVRRMAKIMLTRLGYQVIEAQDGVEALELFQQHQDDIHCVLSDLTMPRMNGWETLAALRKISPDIPVILSSGYDETKVMAEEHTEIPNAFLGKPYQLKGLRETINRVLADQ